MASWRREPLLLAGGRRKLPTPRALRSSVGNLPIGGGKAAARPWSAFGMLAMEEPGVERPHIRSSSGALTWGFRGLVALDQSSVTGLRERSESNSHRTGE